MSPILGIWASSKAIAAADTGAMFPLQVITVGAAGASSVTFTNIPNTYAHLQIRGIVRSGSTSAGLGIVIPTLNSDTTSSNYVKHGLQGNGTSATAFGYTSDRGFDLAIRNSATASTYSGLVVDILDYANSNKYKTLRCFGGFDANGSGQIILTSNLWMSTSAITSVSFALEANSFVQYSQFALYGIRSA